MIQPNPSSHGLWSGFLVADPMQVEGSWPGPGSSVAGEWSSEGVNRQPRLQKGSSKGTMSWTAQGIGLSTGFAWVFANLELGIRCLHLLCGLADCVIPLCLACQVETLIPYCEGCEILMTMGRPGL